MPKKALPENPLDLLSKKPTAKTAKKTTRMKTAPGKKAATEGPKRPRTIHLNHDLDRRLQHAAVDTGQTVSDVIAAAVVDYLKKG